MQPGEIIAIIGGGITGLVLLSILGGKGINMYAKNMAWDDAGQYLNYFNKGRLENLSLETKTRIFNNALEEFKRITDDQKDRNRDMKDLIKHLNKTFKNGNSGAFDPSDPNIAALLEGTKYKNREYSGLSEHEGEEET